MPLKLRMREFDAATNAAGREAAQAATNAAAREAVQAATGVAGREAAQAATGVAGREAAQSATGVAAKEVTESATDVAAGKLTRTMTAIPAAVDAATGKLSKEAVEGLSDNMAKRIKNVLKSAKTNVTENLTDSVKFVNEAAAGGMTSLNELAKKVGKNADEATKQVGYFSRKWNSMSDPAKDRLVKGMVGMSMITAGSIIAWQILTSEPVEKIIETVSEIGGKLVDSGLDLADAAVDLATTGTNLLSTGATTFTEMLKNLPNILWAGLGVFFFLLVIFLVFKFTKKT